MAFFNSPIFGKLCFWNSNTAGPAVVLLHGLGSRGLDWQPQIESLQNRYQVITLDFPGHGESDALNQSLSMADLASCVIELLNHLQIQSAHLIGLSLGGMVAFQAAVDYPRRIDSLIIINSAPGPGSNASKIKRRILMRKILLRLAPINTLSKRIANDLFPLESQAPLRAQYLASMQLVDKKSYRYMVDAISRFNLDQEISRCEVPTLVITADKDYTSVSFKQAFVDRMQNSSLTVIENSRHATPIDSPVLCNQKILEFLSRATN